MKLALYEAPLLLDTMAPSASGVAAPLTRSMPGISTSRGPSRLPADFATQLSSLVAAGRRGDAVELFQSRAVGIPVEVVAQLRQAPFWPALEAIAHTLVYEANIIGDMSMPTEFLASIGVPTLALAGADSPEWMCHSATAIADALPNGQHRCLDGQTHDIVADVVGPVLVEFFGA
jgi:pimeloyl-ACP methyl ester carboxylesterase